MKHAVTIITVLTCCKINIQGDIGILFQNTNWICPFTRRYGNTSKVSDLGSWKEHKTNVTQILFSP